VCPRASRSTLLKGTDVELADMFAGTVRRQRRCHSATRVSSLLRRARSFFSSHQTRSANHASCPLVYSGHDIRLVVACVRAARAHGILKAARSSLAFSNYILVSSCFCRRLFNQLMIDEFHFHSHQQPD
jgi:hypothetical protein